MLSDRIFITGTDTDIGKTLFTAALTTALQNAGYSVVALKPIAAGCEWVNGELRNKDAEILQQVMNTQISYNRINPLRLESPIAPHIAAMEEGVELSVSGIRQLVRLEDFEQSHLIIEGAGGWLVPLNDEETLADYVKEEKLDVILVVGLKLGCINHALLTQQSILADGLNLVGWVANHVDPDMQKQQQNVDSLKKRLACPLIAEIPYIEGDNPAVEAWKYVNI